MNDIDDVMQGLLTDIESKGERDKPVKVRRTN